MTVLESKTVCCAGGSVGIGCFHDHCTGPVQKVKYVGNGGTQRIPCDISPFGTLVIRRTKDGSGEDT